VYAFVSVFYSVVGTCLAVVALICNIAIAFSVLAANPVLIAVTAIEILSTSIIQWAAMIFQGFTTIRNTITCPIITERIRIFGTRSAVQLRTAPIWHVTATIYFRLTSCRRAAGLFIANLALVTAAIATFHILTNTLSIPATFFTQLAINSAIRIRFPIPASVLINNTNFYFISDTPLFPFCAWIFTFNWYTFAINTFQTSITVITGPARLSQFAGVVFNASRKTRHQKT
jgi:hypothetical protein